METRIEFKGKDWIFQHDGTDVRRIYREIPVVNAMQPHTRRREARGDNGYWLTKMWNLRKASDAEFSAAVALYYQDNNKSHRAAEDFRQAAIVLRAKVSAANRA